MTGAVLPTLSSDNTTQLILLAFAVVAVWRALVKDKVAARKAAREEHGREQVRKDLDRRNSMADTRLGRIESTGNQVHVLVNNRMLLALEANAAMARELADLLQTEAARLRADRAERALMEQRTRQTEADRLQPPHPDQGGPTP